MVVGVVTTVEDGAGAGSIGVAAPLPDSELAARNPRELAAIRAKRMATARTAVLEAALRAGTGSISPGPRSAEVQPSAVRSDSWGRGEESMALHVPVGP